MGEGNVGGNGSVKWRFRHHNNAGNQQPIAVKPGGLPPAAHEVGNPGGDAEGLDTIPFRDIGVRHGRPGFFKVTLADHPQPFFVRAVNRENGQNPGVQMEIRIEW